MAVYEFIVPAFPQFREFLGDEPEWYRHEQDYPVAGRLLDFTVMLYRSGDTASVARMMHLIEEAVTSQPDLEDALVIDFIQPIADLGELQAVFLLQLGPVSRTWYDAQF